MAQHGPKLHMPSRIENTVQLNSRYYEFIYIWWRAHYLTSFPHDGLSVMGFFDDHGLQTRGPTFGPVRSPSFWRIFSFNLTLRSAGSSVMAAFLFSQ